MGMAGPGASNRRTRLGLLAILTIFASLLATTGATSAQEVHIDSPRVKPGGASIADSTIAELVDGSQQLPSGSTFSVEVHGPDLERVTELVVQTGGEVTGSVPGFFIEALVNVPELRTIAEHPDVDRVTTVTRTSETQVTPRSDSQELQATSALQDVVGDIVQLSPWHDLGHRGAGQKIGILDVFGQEELLRAIDEERVPVPAGVFCRSRGRECPITQTGFGPHGVGVAEIVHRTAPDAQIYLATVSSLADLTAAIDWFAAQGVTVINRSETSEFDGPGDGTGPVASLVDRAIDQDMIWVAAAGNAGGGGFRRGQNWVGTFNDPDGNGFHNWENGTELMEFTCGFLLGMRWDDWAPDVIATDYDLYILDTPTSTRPEAIADDAQRSLTDLPLERITTNCSGPNDRDYLAIERFDDVQPDGNDVIQILGNFTPMEEWVNEFSATGPGADSANPGSISVGATITPQTPQIAGYSSHGPTLDGRLTPDLLGPSCLPVTDFPECFTGTSSSAPVVAGVLAVLRGSGVIASAPDADAVIRRITQDQGPVGPDTQYGHGVLSLPSPATLGARSTLPTCSGVPATIIGTSGNDVLVGTAGRDVIFGGPGDDNIRGLEGDDLICGGFGEDRIDAGPGADTVLAGPGDDFVQGRNGNDVINGGHGHDDLEGNAGNDEVRGFTGRDYVKGGNDNDFVYGGVGNDRLVGGNGTDSIFGGNGVDRCRPPVESTVSCRP